jgi:hypothetical protein
MEVRRKMPDTEVCLTCGDSYKPVVHQDVIDHWRKYPKHQAGSQVRIYQKEEKR